VTTKYIHELIFVERRMSASGKKQDLLVEAKSFCDGLSNVFLMKRRDPQSRNLLETAKRIIESLCAEKQKPPVPARGASGQSRSSGGMGQLWVKLDELKRENEELRKQKGLCKEDRSQSTKTQHGPGAELNKIRHENETLRSKVAKLEKTIKEMEVIASNVQDQYKSSKVALEATQKSMETVLKEYRLMEDSVKSIKTENDTLKQR
jgi:chromosome segregation ATPase